MFTTVALLTHLAPSLMAATVGGGDRITAALLRRPLAGLDSPPVPEPRLAPLFASFDLLSYAPLVHGLRDRYGRVARSVLGLKMS